MSASINPGPLFAALHKPLLPPSSHRHDPATSKHAERTYARRGTDLAAVVDAVRERPGSTGRQIAAALGWGDDLYRVRRRLSDGRNMGLIRRGPAEKIEGCKPECSWWPK